MLLVAAALIIGVWNTAVGSTGGIMFATLSAVLGPAAAIPVQSVVEGTGAGYRIWHLRHQIDYSYIGAFALGGAVGGLVGFPLVRGALAEGSTETFTIVVAIAILAMTWLPLARRVGAGRWGPSATGLATTFLCLFVGGMGAPIAASLESRGQPHPVVVATSTTAIYLQYVLRLGLFGLTGAIIHDHLGLMAAMTAASLTGTWVGARVLLRVDPERTRQVFRATVTVIALSMIVRVVR
jgi:uncharacterized membrane protein YfcA